MRFRVFERDGFICQYCGKKPPEVILHLDHIVPKSKGGSEDEENMITACADCNLGKSNFEIGKFPKQATKNIENIKEKYEQLKEFYNLQKRLESLVETEVDDISEHWEGLWSHKHALNGRGQASIRKFLKKVSSSEVKEAMDLSIHISDVEGAFKYMCGVLHNKIREREDNDF